MKIFLSLFLQTLLSKTLHCVVLILCICLPTAFAKDNRTKYEEAKLKLEPDIQFYKEQSQKLLQRAKDDLAAIPVEPDARKGESRDVRQRREARAKLEKAINELEIKITNLEKSFRSFPFFISSIDADPAIVSYVARIEERIEKHGTNNPFRINGLKRYGSTTVFFVIREDGALDKTMGIKQASIDGLGEHAIKLVKQMSPFEPFPPEVATQGNHMMFIREFNFAKD